MWRTLFALTHVDGDVSDEEVRFVAEVLEDVPFNNEQRAILNRDIHEKQDPAALFEKVIDAKDKADFFTLAREIVQADGDYGRAEQDIILALQKRQIAEVDLDSLVGSVELSFESDDLNVEHIKNSKEKGAFDRVLGFFLNRK
jgi:uncharacterized membrane protein YebE (DUF533 family)